MSAFAYKVTMTNDDCLAKRAVAVHDDRFLDFDEIQAPAEQHLTSQTCQRCGANHEYGSFVVTDAQRGTPDGHGGFRYKPVRPN